ncbi:hypothetical protein Rsub_06999 [Raphidocelis subcapitata]|uniref:Lon N-terminal domain-containing protein n=1 Tax=Raphidocelis subcapitata TaxID=307507 RepID=A0A2V0PBJ6_9CHLO|nr:hypothetical protein Rsub_06999 [Raphidocelis subcapitata]|eukprot:GBF94465.1 hypothetical protein Rsub_06999 [Raphidocelis subcapitata]
MQAQLQSLRPPGCSCGRRGGGAPPITRAPRPSAAPPRLVRCRSDGGSSGGGSDDKGGGEGAPPPRLPNGSVVFRAAGGLQAPEFPLTCPLLPFPPSDALHPGGTKVLHLYEARYLAMIEKVLKASSQVFVHACVEQPVDPGSNSISRLRGALTGSDFALGLGTLVQVVEVKAQGVGALVRVQGEGRVAIEGLIQAQPYLVGSVTPLLDDPIPADAEEGALKAADELAAMLRECSDLCARFGGVEAAALQQAVLWAQKDRPLLPGLPPETAAAAAAGVATGRAAALERAHRTAWAALSALPQASKSELQSLARYRLAAMAGASTVDRLQLAQGSLEAARAMLRARVALKSLNIGAS